MTPHWLEVSLETIGQTLLQMYVGGRIFLTGAETGLDDTFSTTLLVQSLSVSLFSLCMAAYKVRSNSQGMGIGTLDYLKQQVQMGKGVPYDALRGNVLYHLDLSQQELKPEQNITLGAAMRDNLSVQTAHFNDGGRFDEAAVAQLREGSSGSADGRIWHDVGGWKDTMQTECTGKLLVDELQSKFSEWGQGKVEFEPGEFEDFGIEGLSPSTYVQAGGSHFQPAVVMDLTGHLKGLGGSSGAFVGALAVDNERVAGVKFGGAMMHRDSETIDLAKMEEAVGVSGGYVVAAFITRHCGSLTSVRLSGCALKDEGIQAVCHALRRSAAIVKVVDLDFSANELTMKGVDAIVSVVDAKETLASLKCRPFTLALNLRAQ